MFPIEIILTTALFSAAILSPPDRGVAETIDRYLTRLENLGFSGAVVVAREGEFEFARACGLADREAGIRTTEETVFPLGSITKHFTAAAILRLEMDGALSVEDGIETFFGQLPPDKARITIHQLLCHSSGLPSGGRTVLGATSADDFVTRCAATELVFRPGTGVSYSNIGYGLLAAIIERVTGSTWEEYLKEAIFEPAGMHSTGSLLPKWLDGALAHGYMDDRDTGTLLEMGGLGAWGLIGAGGLLSTIRDMQRWNQALGSQTVLDADAILKMTTVHTGGDTGMGYGCGIHRSEDGNLWFGHDGSNDVFSAEFRRYPETGLFLFAAGNNADMYSFDFTPSIEKIALGHELELPPKVLALEPSRLDAYAGSWELPNGERIEVGRRRGGLTFSSEASTAAALLHPVQRGQVARRAQLIQAVEAAFRSAFDGDFQELHDLVDPYSPQQEFTEMWAGSLDRWTSELGGPTLVRGVPGRNRFGEVAIVAALSFAGGERNIEYSFGEREVGSIRFIEEYPKRVAYSESKTSFLSYDVVHAMTWRASFELDENGLPVALILTNESGEEFTAARGS